MTGHDTWKEWKPEDGDLQSLLQPRRVDKLESRHPLLVLHRNLKRSQIWGLVISLAYVAIMLTNPPWPVMASMVVLLAFNGIILWQSWKLLKGFEPGVLPSANVKQELERHIRSFDAWWKIQETMSVFVYPVAAMGGFILGGTSASETDFRVFLSKPPVMWAMLIMLVVLVPASYLLARWMYRVAFGRHVQSLRDRLKDLEAG